MHLVWSVEERHERVREKRKGLEGALQQLEAFKLSPSRWAALGFAVSQDGVPIAAIDMFSRVDVTPERIASIASLPSLSPEILEQIGIEGRYRQAVAGTGQANCHVQQGGRILDTHNHRLHHPRLSLPGV